MEELARAAAATEAAISDGYPCPGAEFIQDPNGLSRLKFAAQNAFWSLPAMSMLRVGKPAAVGAAAEVVEDDAICRFSLSLSTSEFGRLLSC